MMNNYIDEIAALVKASEHQKAVVVCEKKIIEDPWDTEPMDQMVGIFLDFLKNTQGGPKRRLKMMSMAMRYGRRTEEIAEIYFPELQNFLRRFPKRKTPGQIAIGLGPGRNGSTSLAAMLASAADSWSTHEVSPMIYIPPTIEQVRFHLQRLEMFQWHFGLVADTSHWMIYIRAQLLKHFPDVRFITLKRPHEEIVDSFERIKGKNNHWNNHEGIEWTKTFWDICYPKYPADTSLAPMEQRKKQIARYVKDYYEVCDQLPESNCLTISLKEFSETGAKKIGAYLGVELTQEKIHKNRGGTGDSSELQRQEF